MEFVKIKKVKVNFVTCRWSINNPSTPLPHFGEPSDFRALYWNWCSVSTLIMFEIIFTKIYEANRLITRWRSPMSLNQDNGWSFSILFEKKPLTVKYLSGNIFLLKVLGPFCLRLIFSRHEDKYIEVKSLPVL